MLCQADHTNIASCQRSDVEFTDNLIPEEPAEGVDYDELTIQPAVENGIDHGLKSRPLVGGAALGVFKLFNDVIRVMFAMCPELLALIRNGQVFLGLLACRNSQINDGAAA